MVLLMNTLRMEMLRSNDMVRGIVPLITRIRVRIDSGNYDFMTWSGKSQLILKLNEYERYATNLSRLRSESAKRIEKKKLKDMETELHALLNSTY